MIDALPAAFRARDLALFVFRKGQDDLEGFLAVVAEELIARHGYLQSRGTAHSMSGALHPGSDAEYIPR